MTLHPQYVTDSKGHKTAVLLPIKEYKNIMEELEELNDIRLYDQGIKDKEPGVPMDKAFKLLDAKRKKK